MSRTNLAQQVQFALKQWSLRTRTTIYRASLSDRLGIPGLSRSAPVFQIRVHNHHRHIRKSASRLLIKIELSIQPQVALRAAITDNSLDENKFDHPLRRKGSCESTWSPLGLCQKALVHHRCIRPHPFCALDSGFECRHRSLCGWGYTTEKENPRGSTPAI